MFEEYGKNGKKIILDSGMEGQGLFSAEIILKDINSIKDFKNILQNSNKQKDGIFKYNGVTFKIDYIDVSILLEELESYLQSK